MTALSIGVSAAASWAWGTSLMVGMQIVRQKGLAAWAIWAAANALTLAAFWLLTRRGFLDRRVFDRPAIRWAALLIQMLCLVIQMNILFDVLHGFGLGWWGSYAAASATGVVFTLWMYRRGLATSVRTDVWQWLAAMAAILAIIAVGLWTDAPRIAFPRSGAGDVLWGVWSACILLAGPVGDVQHWQRAEAAGRGSPAYLYGAGFFALYMLLIPAMARFAFSPLMNALLLAAVLCVTTSTIDSIAVALHRTGSRLSGTLVSLGICLCWGVFAQMGVLSLWSSAGVYRVAFALALLWLAWRGMKKDGGKGEGRREAEKRRRRMDGGGRAGLDGRA